jgi:hypothetical protein
MSKKPIVPSARDIEDKHAYWIDLGRRDERQRILDWIEEHRSDIELGPGEFIYRDHFSSESLIAFINGTEK